MNNHKLFFIVVSAIIVFSACSEEIDKRIMLADSLSLAHPDSAMLIMDSIEPTKSRFSRQELMRYELIRAKVQNRAYIDFTTDSVMKGVADYYDHHGSANDRMMAHYLLGCTYRDLKEAPMALQCYYDAVEAADTLSKDCDYSTMMSVWGQIGNVLDKQLLVDEELEAWQQYQKYALKCQDTLNYIAGLEMQVGRYNYLGDTLNILKTTEEASSLFAKYGFTARSAIANFSAILVYLNKSDFARAKELMDRYEHESGYFDENGAPIKGKEGYYRCKGMYYEGFGVMDSAEYYYRLLLKRDPLNIHACNGLYRIYVARNSLDSIIKYSNLKDDCLNLYLVNTKSQAMYQTKGMYDSSRNQKIAHQKEIEALNNKLALNIVGFTFLMTCILATCLYIYHKNKKNKELTELANKYILSTIQLNKVHDEQELLKNDYLKLQDEKESEAISLKNQIEALKKNFIKIDTQKKVTAFINTSLVHHFRKYGQTGLSEIKPNKKDWSDLEVGFRECVPALSERITPNSILPMEKLVIILTYLEFSAKEISVILEKSAQRVTNLKASSNEKLFNQKDARTLLRNLRAVE